MSTNPDPSRPNDSRNPTPHDLLSPELRPSPDRLSDRDPEIPSYDRHRLARSASGTGGSNGTLLDEAVATLDYKPVINPRDPESLKEFARQYRERAERALALEEAALEYNAAVWRAGVIRRRIERRQAMLQRRAERGGKKDSRRANRPVKVTVNAAAWDALKRDAVRRRRTVGFVVGELVSRSVHDGVIPRRRPQPSSVQVFTRLLVDDETWSQFRLLAFDAQLPLGRFIGLLVEREARGLGDDR